MALLTVGLAVGLLVVLIAWARMQPFAAFIIAAIFAAFGLGLPLETIPKTLEHGIGSFLGSLSIIICFGAMFGKLIADSGAAERIAATLFKFFGGPLITLAMCLTGLIVGVPLFYGVGFVLLVPLLFSVAYQSKQSPVYLGVPLLAGLSIAHGFLPPHPSPVALVGIFGADMGLTLVYGLIIALPTLLLAGPVFALTLRGMPPSTKLFFSPSSRVEGDMPGAFISFFSALLPVLMIAIMTALSTLKGLDKPAHDTIIFLGQPVVVLLVSFAVAAFTLRGKRSLPVVIEGAGSAIKDVAGIILIVGGAGALMQVFVDSGVNASLGAALKDLPVPPLVLGWLIAMIVRIALGSATVAGLTAAGIVAPLVHTSGVNPNLMVLAVGAGSLMCSHVNDSGFWMFKEYFGLSLKETFLSWSIMETLIGALGLGFVLLLNVWVS